MPLQDVAATLNSAVPDEMRTQFEQRLEDLRDETNTQDIDDCLRLLEGSPTLMELLCAAYVVNGGILLRSRSAPEEIDMESFERELLDGVHARADADADTA